MIKSKFSFLLSKDKKFIHYNAELDELHCRWTLHDSSKLIHILVNRGKSHPVGADQFCWSPQIPLNQNKDQKQWKYNYGSKDYIYKFILYYKL